MADGLQIAAPVTTDPTKPAVADVTVKVDSSGHPHVKVVATPPETPETPKSEAKDGEPKVEDAAPPTRPTWLPEKFKTADDMKTSTIELMKKHGAPAAFIKGVEISESGDEVSQVYAEFEKRNTPDAGKPKTEEPPKEETPPPVVKSEEAKAKERADYGPAIADLFDKAGISGQELGESFAKTGKVDEKFYKALEGVGISRGLVDSVLGNASSQAHALADAHIAELKNSVGGEKAFEDLTVWAVTGMDKADLDTYNTMVNSGNKGVAARAVQWLQSEYTKANGQPPKLVTPNGGPSSDGDTYGSWDEVKVDMADARYKNGDPAFHRKVETKLGRSKL